MDGPVNIPLHPVGSTHEATSTLCAFSLHICTRFLVNLLLIQLGDIFADRYVVVKKLGWGHFSTVWMARDDRRTSPTAPKVSILRPLLSRELLGQKGVKTVRI